MDDHLSDRALLSNLDAHGGTGVDLGGRKYAKEAGVSPASFMERVRRIHSAWEASEKAKKARKDRDSKGSDRDGAAGGAGGGRKDSSDNVQEDEKSLGEILEAQVISLRRRYDKLIDQHQRKEAELNEIQKKKSRLKIELEAATRFLDEYKRNQ